MFSGSGDDSDTISSADSPVSANRQTRFFLKLLYFFSGVALLALLLSIFVQPVMAVSLIVENLLVLGCVFIVLTAVWCYVIIKYPVFSTCSHNLHICVYLISLIFAFIINGIILFFAESALITFLDGVLSSYVCHGEGYALVTSLGLNWLFDSLLLIYTPLTLVFVIGLGIFSLFFLYKLFVCLSPWVIQELSGNRKEYVTRCLYLLFPVILVAFLYLVYAPYEVFFVNPSDMGSLIFTDFWWIFVVAFVCSVLISVFILSFFTGRAFRWVTCLVFGFGIASYVQMMFLNGGLGILDGNIPSALTDPLQLGVNLLIWVVILAIPLVLNHYVPNILDTVVRYGSLIVTILLVVSVVFMVVTAPVNAFERSDSYYLSAEDQFVLSSNDNVVLFIVDYDSNNYFDALVAEDPSVLEVFKDFTYYNNADSVYMGTFPSVNHMLTGSPLDTTVKIDQWFADSWSSDSAEYFYSSLKEEDYVVNLYVDSGIIDADYMQDKVSNIVIADGDVKISFSGLVDAYIDTSYYKLLPNVLKALIYSDVAGRDYTNFVKFAVDSCGALNNPDYYTGLISMGLSTDIEDSLFAVHHIDGTHPPYSTGENCRYLDDASLMQTQMGCIVLLEEFFSQMKELGVYDDATIIITADHGDFYKDCQPIFLIKEPRTTREEMVVNNAPITHAELLPTILENIGVSHLELGYSIYDIPETEVRERFYYVRAYDSRYPDIPKYNSNTRASSNVYRVYGYSGDRYSLDSVIASEEYEIVPMIQGLF